MTPEALAVAVSLYALAVSVAYFLRDRAALRMEDEFCTALARANGRCDQLAAALRLADECSREAAAIHAGRARAVEEAQSEANRRADRLADIVRRMAKIIGEAPIDWFGASFVDTQVLLTEARAAIGEEKA